MSETGDGCEAKRELEKREYLTNMVVEALCDTFKLGESTIF